MRISDWSSDVFSSDLGKAQIVTFSAAFSERAELCGHIIHGIVHELEQRIGIASVNALKLSMPADWGTPPRIEGLGRAPCRDEGGKNVSIWVAVGYLRTKKKIKRQIRTNKDKKK